MQTYIHTPDLLYPLTPQDIKQREVNCSFPEYPQPADLAHLGYYPVLDNAPTFDPATQKVTEGSPVHTGDHWEKGYVVVQLTQTELDALAAQKAAAEAAQSAADAKKLAENQSALWQAAYDYEYQYISGVAIGLLTLGVLQQKPKALAIAAWSAAHWSDYYTRKATVTKDFLPSLDFTSSGPIPYGVPELRTELGM